ncbi:MAG: virulence RhuM family protein [Holosporales bacterium]|nr:virulence RhuM family protein [Holosporales bacterium]
MFVFYSALAQLRKPRSFGLHYNLDMIISVGYRIKSRTATNFRIWATNILRTFMTQGVVLNEKLLKENQQQLDVLKRTPPASRPRRY